MDSFLALLLSKEGGIGKKKCRKEPSLALIWIKLLIWEFKPENGEKQKTLMVFRDLHRKIQLIAVLPGAANFYMVLFLRKVYFVISQFVGNIALVP